MMFKFFARECSRVDSGRGVPIFAPPGAAAEANKQLHSVFGQDGSALQNYVAFTKVDDAAVEHWVHLMRDAAQVANITFSGKTVLDIGSGGGVSVFALLELCENGVVWASDLCVPLLLDLKAKYDGLSIVPKVALSIVQTSAENLVFRDGSFDLVTGGNILHHAHSPVKMLSEVRRVLRPGGRALFWEPCENGAQLLCLIMDLLAEISRQRVDDQIESAALNVFDQYRHFVATVRGREHSEEFLSTADDKWMFSRLQLRDSACAAGFSVVDLANIYNSDHIVENMMALELGRHGQDIRLPGWSQQVIQHIQSRMSSDFLHDNPFCCRIVLSVT